MSEDPPDCDSCDEPMVKRKNKSTGEHFWGCVNFPYCDNTEAVTNQPAHPGYPDWASDPDQ